MTEPIHPPSEYNNAWARRITDAINGTIEPFPEDEFSESQTVEQKHVDEINALKRRIRQLEREAYVMVDQHRRNLLEAQAERKWKLPSALWWSVFLNSFAIISIGIGLLLV